MPFGSLVCIYFSLLFLLEDDRIYSLLASKRVLVLGRVFGLSAGFMTIFIWILSVQGGGRLYF